MKSNLLIALLTLSIFSGASLQAQAPVPRSVVTIQAVIIALPNAEATRFSAQQNFGAKSADALAALEKLVERKQATPVAILALATKSGQRGVAESGKRILELEATVAADDSVADINVVVSDNGHKVVTSVVLPFGGVKFLGSVQNPTDPKTTEYIFLRLSK
jgi:hypothetical protein